jgi:hypothetical protein
MIASQHKPSDNSSPFFRSLLKAHLIPDPCLTSPQPSILCLRRSNHCDFRVLQDKEQSAECGFGTCIEVGNYKEFEQSFLSRIVITK